MNWLFIIVFVATVGEISSYLEERVIKYFTSDVFQDFTNLWKKHRNAYQNTLELAMRQSVGHKAMNVYIKRPTNPFLVSRGYYHTDNQVHLVLQDMNLDGLPRIIDPQLSLVLPNNVLKLEASVSKMIILTNYMVFRNTSNIVYTVEEQNPYLTSPFLFEQVQNTGQLAITVEGCKLSGIAITTLLGRSVHLGYKLFRLLNCHYSIEIFTPGIASPPVFASYLPNGEGLNLASLLMTPVNAELIPKLQAALFTYINTSAILDTKLSKIRLGQQRIFEESSNYVNNVIRNLNMLTIKKNLGKQSLPDFRIHWNDTYDQGVVDSTIHLHDMVLTGLETVYSTHTGGPIKLATEKVSEEVRFGTLQVRGGMDLQAGDQTKGMHEFAVEIVDVTVHVTVHVMHKEEANTIRNNKPPRHVIEVTGWRFLPPTAAHFHPPRPNSLTHIWRPRGIYHPNWKLIGVGGHRENPGFTALHFSAPGMKFIAGEALVTGYLQSQIPKYLTKHLKDNLKDSSRETDNEYKSAISSLNNPQDENKENVDQDTAVDGNGNGPQGNVDPNNAVDGNGDGPQDNVDQNYPVDGNGDGSQGNVNQNYPVDNNGDGSQGNVDRNNPVDANGNGSQGNVDQNNPVHGNGDGSQGNVDQNNPVDGNDYGPQDNIVQDNAVDGKGDRPQDNIGQDNAVDGKGDASQDNIGQNNAVDGNGDESQGNVDQNNPVDTKTLSGNVGLPLNYQENKSNIGPPLDDPYGTGNTALPPDYGNEGNNGQPYRGVPEPLKFFAGGKVFKRPMLGTQGMRKNIKLPEKKATRTRKPKIQRKTYRK